MNRVLLALSISLTLGVSTPGLHAEDFELHEDFESGMTHWAPSDAKMWSVVDLEDGERALKLAGISDYQPPHRSPHSLALLRDVSLGDFTLTAEVQTLQTTRGHRDMCLFFGFQDPAHFYYVHLGERPDPHSSQIFIVDDAPRTKITETPDQGVPWKDGAWSPVKIVRDTSTGLIEVYFDDMETPQKVAHDTTFTWGAIGLGSFDDLGLWRNVRIEGTRVSKEADWEFFKAAPTDQ